MVCSFARGIRGTTTNAICGVSVPSVLLHRNRGCAREQIFAPRSARALPDYPYFILVTVKQHTLRAAPLHLQQQQLTSRMSLPLNPPYERLRESALAPPFGLGHFRAVLAFGCRGRAAIAIFPAPFRLDDGAWRARLFDYHFRARNRPYLRILIIRLR